MVEADTALDSVVAARWTPRRADAASQRRQQGTRPAHNSNTGCLLGGFAGGMNILVLIVGGGSESGPLTEVLVLDTLTWQVSQAAPLCAPRAHATALHLPPYAIVVGGADAGSPLAEAMLLDAAAAAAAHVAPLPLSYAQQTCTQPLQPPWREVRLGAKSALLSAARAKHSLSLVRVHWLCASRRRDGDGGGQSNGRGDGNGGGGSGGVCASDDASFHHLGTRNRGFWAGTGLHDHDDAFEINARICDVCGKHGCECAIIADASALLLGGDDGGDAAEAGEGGTHSTLCNRAGHGHPRGASAFLLRFTNFDSSVEVP
eukprot:1345354-Pleurochrysis_carterae.AAC.1